jgi:hypothetical protein
MNVDQPEAWGREHRWFLEAVFAEFDRDGEWPRIEAVQEAMATTDVKQAVAIGRLVIDITNEIGARHGERIALTVRGLSLVPAAAPLLADFVAAMRVALDFYPGPEGSRPKLTGSAVRAAVKLDDRTYHKVSLLILEEGWFFGGGSGSQDQEWERWIRVEILLLKDAVDISGYLAVLAEYRFGAPTQERESGNPKQLVVGPRGWLAARSPSIRDLLAITILGGVAVALILWLLS